MPFVETMRSFVASGAEPIQSERPNQTCREQQGTYPDLVITRRHSEEKSPLVPDFASEMQPIQVSDVAKLIQDGKNNAAYFNARSKIVTHAAAKPEPVVQEQPPAQKAVLAVFQRSDFQVGCMIGQGSFATVHKAKHLASGTSIAIKVVRPESELDFGTGPNGSSPAVCYKDVLRAMKKEVNIMEALIGHPHIVQVLGTAEDCRVFVMERAVSDLYSIVKQQETRLPLGHAKLWAEHMLTAIAYIHSMGIVHQDLKSSNVLVFGNRAAKLCDFGLAKKGSNIMVVDRELVTLWYRAPELLMGDDTYTVKVDEWGVGCVLLEMMIGVPPFKGKPECVCSCPQITHRNFNSDQLMKIFLMMGSPEKKSTLSCCNHFNRWPTFPRMLESTLQRVISPNRLAVDGAAASASKVEEAVKEWTNLIGSMLSLTPSARPTAAQILDWPFFSSNPLKDTPSQVHLPSSPCALNSPDMHGICRAMSNTSTTSADSTTVECSPDHRHPPVQCSLPQAKPQTRLSPETKKGGHFHEDSLIQPTPGRKGSLNLDRGPVMPCIAAAPQRKGSLPAKQPISDIQSKTIDCVASGSPDRGTLPRGGVNIMSTIRNKMEGFMRTGSLGTRKSADAGLTTSAGKVSKAMMSPKRDPLKRGRLDNSPPMVVKATTNAAAAAHQHA